jgi:hypothetical protein
VYSYDGGASLEGDAILNEEGGCVVLADSWRGMVRDEIPLRDASIDMLSSRDKILTFHVRKPSSVPIYRMISPSPSAQPTTAPAICLQGCLPGTMPTPGHPFACFGLLIGELAKRIPISAADLRASEARAATRCHEHEGSCHSQ